MNKKEFCNKLYKRYKEFRELTDLELFTKEEKTKLEETESQAEIEKKLREKLKYIKF